MRLLEAALAATLIMPVGSFDAVTAQQAAPPRAPDILVYSHYQCPYCQEAKRYLTELQGRMPDLVIQYRELSEDPSAARDLQQLGRSRGMPSVGVPAILIGGRVLELGFDRRATPRAIEDALRQLGLPATGATPATTVPLPVPDGPRALTLPLVGDVDTHALSLPAMTAMVAFVDGFNPCSLWVLTFLLGIVLYSGSRKRIAVVGGTFLLVTAAAYGAFMLGVFTTLQYMSFLPWVTTGVAGLALLFAVVNIKDYFWFRQGLSFTISDRHKPGIYQRVRALMHPGRSLPALVAGTVMLALGITIVELPCTAGFPVVWSGIVAARDVGTAGFATLFVLYVTIYLLDELLIFGAAVVTMRRSRVEEKHGRVLKLIGGVVMLALALTLIAAPEAMHSLSGTFAVFGAAAAASGAILIVHRKILPEFGIRIGTEEL
jgi:cytochrome c biogenesis protein CcdA/glutaredoxin